jgi:pyruvate formate lyase activating enzyme
MKEALFYEKTNDNNVVCRLCNHHCRIKEGRRGVCGVRENRAGALYSLVYGRVVSENIDPIEKKPLFHVFPGSLSYSIATVGCNFKCDHCQNYQISQYPHMHGEKIIGAERTAEEIVDAAVQANCRSISYTYVEPTIFYEFAYDCCLLARKKEIRNVFVSNGYMDHEVTRHLAPVLDAINIDIKAFSEKFYKQVCKAQLAPVLENVRLMHALGVWVEITTLVIPGWNDSAEELSNIAKFIKNIDPTIPWHVTGFYPTFKMLDRQRTSVDSLSLARDIGEKEGLDYVFVGNIPGAGGENTNCPGCGQTLIQRCGYTIEKNNLANGQCPSCNRQIQGIWE